MFYRGELRNFQNFTIDFFCYLNKNEIIPLQVVSIENANFTLSSLD